MAFRIGVGVVPASAYLFFVALLVLIASGVDYLLIRGRERRPGLGGLTFRQVHFSWPYVVVAAVVVLLFVI